MDLREIDDWFVREVLPLERILEGYLRRNWHNQADIPDIRQDVYVRVFEAAKTQLPDTTGAFVLAVARNIIIDRMRRARIVSIEAVADLESLSSPDVLTPERLSSGREEVRNLQAALDQLPPRCREVMVLRKVEGLSQKEVARRLGIAEDTVEKHTANGLKAMAQYMLGVDKSGASVVTLKDHAHKDKARS